MSNEYNYKIQVIVECNGKRYIESRDAKECDYYGNIPTVALYIGEKILRRIRDE